MPDIFKIAISHKTFEKSSYSKNTLEKTFECAEVYDVENIPDFYIKFLEYLKDGENYKGVTLLCDYGRGYGFENGKKTIALVPGEEFHFSYEGTCVDDDGCPEDFSIEYYISIFSCNKDE